MQGEGIFTGAAAKTWKAEKQALPKADLLPRCVLYQYSVHY